MKIEIIEHESMSGKHRTDLRALLGECFPGRFGERCYFKQEPHKRVLAYEGQDLVGHVALDYRIINVGGELLRILGVKDLCVKQNQRHHGTASHLMTRVEVEAAGRDFLVLFAEVHKLYLHLGYERVTPAPVRWLEIEDMEIDKIREEDLGDIFLIKPLGDRSWPAGEIDLLGYLF